MSSAKGIGFKVAATLSFSLMVVCIKALDGSIPTGQIVFFRSFAALFPLAVWLGLQGNIIELTRTRHLGGHAIRGVSGTVGMFFNFLALAYLPLADATALSYVAPLFTVVLAGLFLGEAVRIYRWAAVAMGFAGVLVMLSPHLLRTSTEGSSELNAQTGILLGAGFGLIAAFSTALSSIQIRRLTASETPGAIVLYFSVMTSLIGLATIPFGWAWPTPGQFLFLVGSGLFGGVAQILVTLGLRHAQASMLAPFEYATMIWSILAGYIFFLQSPAFMTIIGACLVALAGLFAIWREQVRHRTLRLSETVMAEQNS